MNRLDVENMAIYARHLRNLRDKITTAKLLKESREKRMDGHREIYPNMDEEKRKILFFEEERDAVKEVEQEYEETLSAGCELGLILPFSPTEIRDYINM